MKTTGKVWLAGAGPGDAGLLTVKAEMLCKKADVIVYDALVSTEILCWIPQEKEMIHVGKRAGKHSMPQEEINRLLVQKAREGKQVLRLKGGDPFLFGRGGEEAETLRAEHIPFEIIPGITSAFAAPAYAGIPVTHRDYVSSVHVVTAHPRKDGTSRIDFDALVKAGGTLVFLMGVSSIEFICRGLLRAGISPKLPAAVVESGTLACQRRVVSDIGHLQEEAAAAGIKAPAVILAGEVCGLADHLSWAEARPLAGRQFLITRPRKKSEELAICLRDLGAQALELPAIYTREIQHNPELEAVLNEFASEGKEAWLVFTSAAGVSIFFDRMVRRGEDLRTLLCRKAAVKFAVIGKATGEELKKRGIRPDLMPEIYDAENLGRLLAKEVLPGSEIIVVRAEHGSPELLPPIQEAGLFVTDIPLYQTVQEIHETVKEQIRKELKDGKTDAVIFTSASCVRGFVNEINLEDYTSIHALCIGKQTAAEAEKYGMQIFIPKEASTESMVEKLLDVYGNRQEG